MGLQITVLLADVIYVDILQSTVPVFDSFGSSPLILRMVLKSVHCDIYRRICLKTLKSFFIVSIVLLCVCLMVSTYTLFIYHCAIYECKNFSRTEAIISRAIANMFTKCACGWWEIEVPENTEKIAEHEGTFLILWIISNRNEDQGTIYDGLSGFDLWMFNENQKRWWYISQKVQCWRTATGIQVLCRYVEQTMFFRYLFHHDLNIFLYVCSVLDKI